MPALLLFDEDCRLCRALVRCAARRSSPRVLRFAALESPCGQRALRELGLPPHLDSLVLLLEDGTHLLRSDAVLAAARLLGCTDRALVAVRVLPASWRDAAYRVVARVRRYVPLPDRPLERSAYPGLFVDEDGPLKPREADVARG